MNALVRWKCIKKSDGGRGGWEEERRKREEPRRKEKRRKTTAGFIFEIVSGWGAAVLRPYMIVPTGCGAR
jgi:hypothetical protein